MKQPSIAAYRQQIGRTKYVVQANNYGPLLVTVGQFLADIEALAYLSAKDDSFHFEHFKVK